MKLFKRISLFTLGFILYFSLTVNATTFTPTQMDQDLNQLITLMKENHPEVKNGFNDEQNTAINEVKSNIQKDMTDQNFYFELKKITATLHDYHSYIYSSSFENYSKYNYSFSWLHDNSLIINKGTNELQVGDKIISIGGKTPEQIYNIYKKIISGDSEYSIKNQLETCLGKQSYLQYGNLLDNNTLKIKIERNGQILEKNIPNITTSYIFRDMYYTIEPENNMGCFYLPSFYNSNSNDYQIYKTKLNEFFTLIKQNNINNVVWDLRYNEGGYDSCLIEFIRYLNIDRYIMSGNNIDNYKYNNLSFNGNIYILSNNDTASMSVLAIDTIKQNHLGVCVGENSRMRPGFYSNSSFQNLNNSKFQIRLAHDKLRGYNDKFDSIQPDIPIYTTREDIINNIDPQLEVIKNISKNNIKNIETNFNEEYLNYSKSLTFNNNHTINIKFKNNINVSELYNNIYVKDINGNKVKIDIHKDGNNISINPINSYNKNSIYFLYILSNVGIPDSIKMTFKIS